MRLGARSRAAAIGVAAVLAALAGSGCSDDGRRLDDAEGVPTTALPEPDAAPPSTVDPAADRAAALAAWEAYRAAILAKDGAAAARVVSEGTFAQYAATLDRALTMNRTLLSREDTFDVLMVLAVRSQFNAAEIEGLDGRQFFELGVNEGLIAESTVQGLVFDGVVVTGDEARLTTSNADQAARGMHMRREAGAWKVDLGEYMTSLGAQFDRLGSQQGTSRIETALKMLGVEPGSADAERLLEPLKRQG